MRPVDLTIVWKEYHDDSNSDTTQEAQLEALEELASKRRVTLIDLVHEAIDKLLRSATLEDAERRRRALAAVGRFKGPKDLARNHDEYLAEDFDS